MWIRGERAIESPYRSIEFQRGKLADLVGATREDDAEIQRIKLRVTTRNIYNDGCGRNGLGFPCVRRNWGRRGWDLWGELEMLEYSRLELGRVGLLDLNGNKGILGDFLGDADLYAIFAVLYGEIEYLDFEICNVVMKRAWVSGFCGEQRNEHNLCLRHGYALVAGGFEKTGIGAVSSRIGDVGEGQDKRDEGDF